MLPCFVVAERAISAGLCHLPSHLLLPLLGFYGIQYGGLCIFEYRLPSSAFDRDVIVAFLVAPLLYLNPADYHHGAIMSFNIVLYSFIQSVYSVALIGHLLFPRFLCPLGCVYDLPVGALYLAQLWEPQSTPFVDETFISARLH